MAILRQFNYLGQMRWDLPFARSIESAVAFDFDMLAGNALSGRYPLVLKGLTVSTTNTIGAPVESLQLNVAGALIMHYGASESGTIYEVDDNVSPETLSASSSKVTGSFTASSVNYIGLDFIRLPDPTTSDSVQFLDADTDVEVSQIVPLARTLQYKIIISTQNFSVSTNVLPIAKVVTSSTNTVVSITDARNMMFRLGSGGDNPNALHTFTWPSRTEPANTFTGGADPFSAADKSINNLKDSLDSIFTSIWDVKGGEHWYSATNRDNVKVLYGNVSVLSDNFIFDTAPNPDLLKWESVGLAFENADNSGVYFNQIADNTAGVPFNTDGLCLYVDLQRESNATAVPAIVGTLQTLGTSTIPGRRIILAWRWNGQVFIRDRQYNTTRVAPVASTTVLGVVKTNATPADALNPTAIILTTGGGAFVTATSGSTAGFTATGFGGGAGIVATGGATNANGGTFTTGGTTSTGSAVYASDPNGFGRAGTFVAGTTGGNAVDILGNLHIVANASGTTDSIIALPNAGGTNNGGIFSRAKGTNNAFTADVTGSGSAFLAQTGNITATVGNIVATAGNVQVAAASNFTYATARTAFSFIAPEEFIFDTGPGTPNYVGGLGAVWWASDASIYTVAGRAYVPAGATITAVDILADNGDASAQLIGVNIYKISSGTATSLFSNNISIPSGGTAYQSAAGLTPSTMASGGGDYVRIRFTLPAIMGVVHCEGFRITYTYTDVRPS